MKLTRTEQETIEKSIYHKNLLPVTYIAGVVESPGYEIFKMMPEIDKLRPEGGEPVEQFITRQPENVFKYSVKWDGEAHI